MQVEFYKYQGAGNDFILLDNFSGSYNRLTIFQISSLCNRRFGIGADGLIRINKHQNSDFEVDYFNADGTKSFCGNGARCSVRFVHENMFKKDNYTFQAIDGLHVANLEEKNISLEMKDVRFVEYLGNETFELNTGSPHFVHFEKDIANKDLLQYAKSIRYNDPYKKEGINVNLVEQVGDNHLKIRTYERGVEDETLSCGTGITAAAIACAHAKEMIGHVHFHLNAVGGDLDVKFFMENPQNFQKIRLIGPAEFVFKGAMDV